MTEFFNSQTPTPQDIPLPPSHLLSAERWSPPVRAEALDSQVLNTLNPTFIIDSLATTNIDLSTIGIEGESPKGWNTEITGIIGIGGELEEDEPKYKIPIVKQSVNGNDTFTIMSIGSSGKPKAVHTFALDRPVHIGRSPEDNVDIKNTEVSVNLQELGIPQDIGISRDHLTLTWTGQEILVTDHSLNGTKVEAIEKKPSREKQIGIAATSLSGGSVENVPERKLIDSDSVPESGEEAIRMNAEKEAIVRQQKVEANAPRIAELQARMDFIRDQVGEEESQKLWRYGSYDSQARELDRKGQKGAAIDLFRIADEELAKMKPETARYKKEYWSVMTQKHDLEFPK